jgi:hypothetical protein
MDKTVRVVAALLFAVPMFVFGLSAFFLGIFWLIDFCTAAKAWADTGNWPAFTVTNLLEKWSIKIPHTNMIGLQNILDFFLVQSGLTWWFLIVMGCVMLCSWFSHLIDTLPQKAR